MNYKVLYRKYRPSNFSSVVGQDYSIQMIQNAIINDKISHAYLFTGPRGTGKTSTAKIFAKTINCLNPVNGEACGECSNCLHFAESPDIIEIDAASNNGVDDIRELINNVKIAPSEGKYKIYIIDEVHMMTTSAFNALLLTLEEPPKHAVFIMATTNVENVPITILSRCQRFNFQKITLEDLKKQILYVCGQENIAITEEAVEEIAYLSEGGMRDALSLLDQLSSTSEEITLDKILTNYGSISSKFIKDLISMLENYDVEGITTAFHDLENTSSDYKIFIKKLVQELTHVGVKIKLGNYTASLSYKQVKNLVFELNEVLNKINININPYVLIELILLGIFDNTNIKNTVEVNSNEKNSIPKEISSVEPTIEQAEPKVKKEISSVIDVAFLEERKKIRINNCFVAAKKEDLVKYQQIWTSLGSNLTLKPDFISFILDSSLVAASPDYAIISCKLESTANLINARLDEFSSDLKEFFGTEVHFIALSNEEWMREKQEYVKNVKAKQTYHLMEEKIQEQTEEKSEIDESIATNVFNRDKIVIV